MAKLGKKLREKYKEFDKNQLFNIEEALTKVKEAAVAKFNETVEVHFKMNLKGVQSFRGSIVLPHSVGKNIRVAVFADADKAKEAEEAGADIVGYKDLIEKVQKGFLDFDVTVATPGVMRDVGKLGRILGVRGLMPTPKLGTVTNDVAKVIKELKKGRKEYRADKTGVLHMSVGKADFDVNVLKENIMALYEEIKKEKPTKVKGEFMKTITVSSTQGIGVKLDIKAL